MSVILFTGERGICPRGFCSGAVSVQGVSVQRGGLCPEGWSLSRGVSVWGSLCQGRLPLHGEERAVRILLECILVMAVNSTCALANVTYLPFSIDIRDEKSNVFLMNICSVFYIGERTINGLSENT